MSIQALLSRGPQKTISDRPLLTVAGILLLRDSIVDVGIINVDVDTLSLSSNMPATVRSGP